MPKKNSPTSKVAMVVWGAIVRDKAHPNADMHGLIRAVVRLPEEMTVTDVLPVFAGAVIRWRGRSTGDPARDALWRRQNESKSHEQAVLAGIQLVSRSYSIAENQVTAASQGIVYCATLPEAYLSIDSYSPYLEPRI